jgi:hypothetical protein
MQEWISVQGWEKGENGKIGAILKTLFLGFDPQSS